MIDVWLITASYYPHIGGAEQQAQRLAEKMRALGWNVAVLTRRHNVQYPYLPPRYETINGVPVYRVFSKGYGKLGSLVFFMFGLLFLLIHGRGALYHAQDIGAPGWIAVFARYLFQGKCLVKLRTGVIMYEKRLETAFGAGIFKSLLSLTDRIIVVNSETENFLRRIGISPDKVVWLPNSVDLKFFRPASMDEKNMTRSKYGFAHDHTMVLFVGRIEAVKGADLLLNSWFHLPIEKRSQVQLILVGDGSARLDLEKQVSSRSTNEGIIFAGIQNNVRDWYWMADLFILPSRAEGQSNALVEAMACGLPVVCSDVGGAKDLVMPGQSGLLFSNNDPTGLLSALEILLGNRKSWLSLGIMARDIVEHKASLDNTASVLSDIYIKLSMLA